MTSESGLRVGLNLYNTATFPRPPSAPRPSAPRYALQTKILPMPLAGLGLGLGLGKIYNQVHFQFLLCTFAVFCLGRMTFCQPVSYIQPKISVTYLIRYLPKHFVIKSFHSFLIIKVYTLLFVLEECSGKLYRASWCNIRLNAFVAWS